MSVVDDRGDEARTTLRRPAAAPTRRGRRLTQVPTDLRTAGVSGREMDVLVLVCDGLTNRQIAERLFLSHRTVDTHVASLLAMTSTASRLELRAQSLPKQGAPRVRARAVGPAAARG